MKGGKDNLLSNSNLKFKENQKIIVPLIRKE